LETRSLPKASSQLPGRIPMFEMKLM